MANLTKYRWPVNSIKWKYYCHFVHRIAQDDIETVFANFKTDIADSSNLFAI